MGDINSNYTLIVSARLIVFPISSAKNNSLIYCIDIFSLK